MDKKVYLIIAGDYSKIKENEEILSISNRNRLRESIIEVLVSKGCSKMAASWHADYMIEENSPLDEIYSRTDKDGFDFDPSSKIENLTIRVEEIDTDKYSVLIKKKK